MPLGTISALRLSRSRKSLRSSNSPICAMANADKTLYGVQFHPEVAHTPRGAELIANFIFRICRCEPTWTPGSFIEESIARIRRQVGDATVICGLSGGVDSSVAAALVHRAIGDQLTCIFVDTGLLRKGERGGVERAFRRHMGMRLVVIDACSEFLQRLAGVEEPERKRKIIGETFIRVFERAATEHGGDARFLVQGTLYPDVIESLSVRGPSATIKSHHNVGGLPEDMHFHLVEPLRELFKDEVRNVGRELGLPEELVGRLRACKTPAEVGLIRTALADSRRLIPAEDLRRRDQPRRATDEGERAWRTDHAVAA